jgi:allophanate hydrolase subunit 2
VTEARGLLVMEPGLLTTVQDLGRYGWASFGVPAAGALDEEALRLANRLVGNAESAAALEITFVGPVLRAAGDLDLAVAGGAFGPAPAARCALSLVLERRTVARNGQAVPLAVDTLCVHGDTPNAPAIAAEVRAALVEAEIIVRSLRDWRPAA